MGKIVAPQKVGDASSWHIYRKQLEIWKLTSGEDPKLMGAKIASTFTDNDKIKLGLAKRFYESVDVAKLHVDTGYEYVIKFLEKELGKSNLDLMVESWDGLEYFKKTKEMKIQEYCEEFNSRYLRAENAGCGKISPYVRAFMLLNHAGVSGKDRTAILAQVEGPEKDEDFYEKMEKYLKIQSGSGPAPPDVGSSRAEAVKTELEPGDHEIFTATINGKEYTVKRKKFNKSAYNKRPKKDPKKGEEDDRKNRIGPDGKRSKCYGCGSEYHYANSQMCPKNKDKNANLVTATSDSSSDSEAFCIILHTEDETKMSLFTIEARGAAAMDTCCSGNVAGEQWFDAYLEDLPGDLKEQVVFNENSFRKFRFGNGESLTSIGQYTIPANIIGKPCTIKFDLIKSDIPLLLSKKAMKKANVSIDLATDTITWQGVRVHVYTSSSGHYCLPLMPQGGKEEVFKIQEVFSAVAEPNERKSSF